MEIVRMLMKQLVYQQVHLLVWQFSPYWNDLLINAGTQEGIYGGIVGNSPNRTLIFEYYTTQFQQLTQYYQFHVIFFRGTT